MTMPVPAPTIAFNASAPAVDVPVDRAPVRQGAGLPGVAMPAYGGDWADQFDAAADRSHREAVEEARRQGVIVSDDPMPDHVAWAGAPTTIAPEGCGCDLCRHHTRMFAMVVRNELRQAKKLRRR